MSTIGTPKKFCQNLRGSLQCYDGMMLLQVDVYLLTDVGGISLFPLILPLFIFLTHLNPAWYSEASMILQSQFLVTLVFNFCWRKMQPSWSCFRHGFFCRPICCTKNLCVKTWTGSFIWNISDLTTCSVCSFYTWDYAY